MGDENIPPTLPPSPPRSTTEAVSLLWAVVSKFAVPLGAVASVLVIIGFVGGCFCKSHELEARIRSLEEQKCKEGILEINSFHKNDLKWQIEDRVKAILPDEVENVLRDLKEAEKK